MIAQSNIGSLQSQYIKKIISTFCESSISFGSCRATSDCFLYVHADHLKMIKKLFNNYNTPQNHLSTYSIYPGIEPQTPHCRSPYPGIEPKT